MVCSKCGAVLEDRAGFCTQCGMQVVKKNKIEAPKLSEKPEIRPEELMEQAKNRKRRKKRIKVAAIAMSAAIVLGTGIGIWLRIYLKPENVFGRRVNAGNYEAAQEIYSESGKADRRIMQEYLVEVSNEYYEDYRVGKAGYEETRKKLDEIKDMGISEILEEINAAINKTEAMFYSNSCYEKGEEHYASEDYKTAYRYYLYVIEEDKNYQQALEKAETAKERYSGQVLEETEALKKDGKYKEALEMLAAAQELIGETDALRQETEECQALYEESRIASIVKNASEIYNAGDILGAISMIADGIKTYPQSELLINERSSYVNQILDKVEEYKSAGMYSDALSLLSSTKTYVGEMENINEQITLCNMLQENSVVDSTISEAQGRLAENGFVSALQIINRGLRSYPKNEKLLAAKDDCENQYIADTLIRIEEFIAAKDYRNAEEMCRDVMNIVENDAELNKMLNHINEIRPVSLSELKAVNTYDWPTANEGKLENSLEIPYENVQYYWVVDCTDSSYAEYFVNGEYSSLTGMIAAHSQMSQVGYSSVAIYADNVCVYKSEEIIRTTLPFEFNVNISGAQFIKVAVYGRGYSWGYKVDSDTILTDLILERSSQIIQ